MIPSESVELTGYLSKCGVWFSFQSETKIQGLYLFQQSQNNSHGPLEPERTLKNNLSQTLTLQVNFGAVQVHTARQVAELTLESNFPDFKPCALSLPANADLLMCLIAPGKSH